MRTVLRTSVLLAGASCSPPAPPRRRSSRRRAGRAGFDGARSACRAEPASLSSLVSQVDIPHESFSLANGLTVIVHEDHKAPVVAVSTWYNVGSKDEPRARPASPICSSI